MVSVLTAVNLNDTGESVQRIRCDHWHYGCNLAATGLQEQSDHQAGFPAKETNVQRSNTLQRNVNINKIGAAAKLNTGITIRMGKPIVTAI